MADPSPPIPRPVKGLAAVSLCNDFASEMVYPLLPAFVTTGLGGGPVALGALDGAADLTAAVLRWWSGRAADRPGWRRPLIAVGYLLAIVLRPVTALASQAWQVVAVRVLDRVGKGLRSPARDAVIADATPAAVVGRAFGLHRSADHLGAVLGSLAAFELLRRGVPIREVLGWSLLPGAVAFLVLLVALRLAGPGADRAAGEVGSDPEARPGPRGPLLWLALLAAARLPETLLILRLQDLGLAVVLVPLLWALLHVVKSLASYPAGFLSDRLGARAALGLGSLAYAATILGLARPVPGRIAVALFLLHGIAAGLVEPAERAAVAGVAGAKRGQLFGTYQGLAGVGALVGGLGYGWLYQARGPETALAGAALVTAVALGAWLLGGRLTLR